MTAYARRNITGGAVATTLASGISSGDTAFTLALATGWPSGGANGDFFVVIDRGNSNEEKILCASRVATAVTVQTAGRGVDGTSAVAHSSGASVEHCLFARDADEANLAVAKTVGVASATGQILVADGANSFAAVQGKTSGQLLMGNGTTVVSQAATGDVTISGAGATTIGAQKVGVAKMTSTATDRLFGRDTAAAGAGEELTVGGGVEFTGSGGIQRSALTGDVTATAGSNATAIAANAVTLAKLATQADQTVLGNRSGGTAVPTAMTAAQTMALLSGTAAADFAINSHKITGVSTPTASGDAATKGYVDGVVPTAYSTWTPAWTQGVSVTSTTQYAKYLQTGLMVSFWAQCTITSTGTNGALIFCTLPVAHVFGARDGLIGGGSLFLNSGNFFNGGLTAWGGSSTSAYINFTSLLTSSLQLQNGILMTICGTYPVV